MGKTTTKKSKRIKRPSKNPVVFGYVGNETIVRNTERLFYPELKTKMEEGLDR